MNNKEKALQEFRSYCRSLCPPDDKGTHKIFRLHKKVEAFKDCHPRIEGRFRELIGKYALDGDDVRNDFHSVVSEFFGVQSLGL